MIKNIVLDIGNVLIPFSWRQHLDHFGFSDEIKKRLADAVFLNDDWNEIDRGVLTKEELLARFIENDPGIEKEIYMVMLVSIRTQAHGCQSLSQWDIVCIYCPISVISSCMTAEKSFHLLIRQMVCYYHFATR